MMILSYLLEMFVGSSLVFGSGFPKDSTTEWCGRIRDQESIYRCYPNPWGSGSVFLYFRFPDTVKTGGCLTEGFDIRFRPDKWILVGGGGPYLTKLTLDQDKYCLDSYSGAVVNRAQPGDSIDIEFWMTPSDTAVTDTIRGWFKAYYRGNVVDLVDLGYVPAAPRRTPAQTPRWTPSGLVLARGTIGPFDLRDLRGRSVPVRPVDQGYRLLLKPAAPLRPGLYRLRWPGGSTAFLVPGS